MKSILFCLLAAMAVSTYGETKFVLSYGSGASTSIVTGDPIVGPLTRKSSSKSFSQGSLSSFHGNGLSELEEWDGTTFCDFDPVTSQPKGALLTYISASSISSITTLGKSRDQLYLVMNPSPPSTQCFNDVDGSVTFEIFYDVTGGAGRFEGASGTIRAFGSGQRVVDGHSGFTFTAGGFLTTLD